ncbi:tyrosine-type recombinase/integrase [Woodsholea maritima]|uniref:tyrosine-type recombinase/integrase n=1 Tax=Woodsholea maritima TaxID=240237 RepID=UPI000361A555|nr:site-specific integrase [Woodsholea maritima]
MPRTATRKIRLTNRAVEEAKPEDKQYRINDADQSGFYLMVRPSGKKTFGVRYVTRDGKNSEAVLGEYPGLIPLEARQLAARKRSEVQSEGMDPVQERRNQKTQGEIKRARSFEALAEAYLTYSEQRREKALSTLAKEKQHLSKNILPNLGKIAVEDIKRSTVTEALEAIRRSASTQGKNGNAAANDCLKYIRQVLNHGVEREWIETNKARDIKKYKEESRERIATDEELRKLWLHWEHRKNKGRQQGWPSASALQIAALTLQRGDEVAGMCWDEIDLTETTWNIARERKKERRSAVVPLSKAAVKILTEARDKTGKLSIGPFQGRFGGTIRRDALTRAFARDCEALGIIGLTVHDLRRTGRTTITHPEKIAMPFDIGEAVLNHAVGNKLTRTYDKNDYLPQKRQALEAWGQWLLNIVHNENTKESNVVPLRGQS